MVVLYANFSSYFVLTKYYFFRFYEIIFRFNERLFRFYEIVFRFNERLFRSYEIIFRFYEIIFRFN